MMGFPSVRCVHGYRCLKAFKFIRGCNGMIGHINTLNHSLPYVNHDSTYLGVYWSASFRNKSDNVSKNGHGKDMMKASRNNAAKDLQGSIFQDSNVLVDLVLEKDTGLPSKMEIKASEWHLDSWFNALQTAKKSSKPLSMWQIVDRKFQSIVSLSMKQGAPAVLMEKCLRLLLMEQDDHESTRMLLMQASESAPHMPIKTLVNTVLMLSEANPTELRTSVRKDLVAQAVNKRWYEISHRHIVTFMYQLDDLFNLKAIHHDIRNMYRSNEASGSSGENIFSDGNIQAESLTSSINIPVLSMNVDRCILNVVDELKAKDLARILTLMARWRNRNETLIAALIHRLNQTDMSTFTHIQVANLLSACSTLVIHNETLLEKVEQCLLNLDPISPSLTVSVMASFSHLKWYNADFISKNLTFLKDHKDELTGKEACSVLMTLANLYALPDSEEHKHLITALGNHALSNKLSVFETVNVMLSLAVLFSLDKDKASSVLDPSFIQQFQESGNLKHSAILQKLNQISTAAKLEISGYSGELMPENVIKSSSVEEISQADMKLQSTLCNALSKFVNISSYVKFVEKLPGGYTADALMCADADGSLKPLTHCEVERPEKHASFKLAIKIIPFNGVIIPHNTPSGIHQMESRHLRMLGYTPVSVLYSDLRRNKSALEHVNAIRARIKASVQAVSKT